MPKGRWPGRANFTDEHRFRVWHLAVLPDIREVALGIVNAVRSFGEPVLRHIEPKEAP
jgi:hypothetical protein